MTPDPKPQPTRFPNNLTGKILEYYRVSILLVATVLCFGSWIFVSLPRSEDPEFDVFESNIVTLYPGANADEVERLVTIPIEEELETIEGVVRIEADSSAGLSYFHLELDETEVVGDVLDEVEEAIADIEEDLPAGAESPEVYRLNSGEIPVAVVSLVGVDDYGALEEWAEWLADQIEEVDGVAEVELEALPERQILVRADNDRLAQYRLSLVDLSDVLARENAAVPGGRLDVGPRRYRLENPNELGSLDEIRATPIGSRDGSVVFVRDVAAVEDGFEDARYLARTNGRPALLLAVQKKDGTNTVAVGGAVRRILERARTELPEGFELVVVNDRGRNVAELLSGLGWNALSGGIIVLLMVTLFLGRREALVVSISIPLSVLIAFVAMAATGIDIDQVSIFGLVLALGMLVDSGLVVVENIGRHLEEGADTLSAVVDGADEVRWPVLSSTLTTICAFVPMLFMTGNIGAFIRGMPLTLIYSLAGSFVVAVTVIPLLCYALWRRRPPAPEPDHDTATIRWYLELAKLALRHRAITLGLAIVAFAVSVWTIPHLGLQFFPKAEKGVFLVNVRLARDASLDETSRIVERVEAVLATDDAVRDVTSNIGKGAPRVYYNVHREPERTSYAQLVVNLRPDAGVSVDDVVARLQPRLRSIVGAAVEPVILQQGPNAGAPIQVRVRGDDPELLAATARRIRERIADVEGLADLRDTMGEKVPRLVMDLDREKASLLGVDTLGFSRTVFAALNGEEATLYREGEEQVPLVVTLAAGSIREVSQLERLYLPSRSGGVVPFSEVATVREVDEFPLVSRRDGRRTVTVESDVTGRLTNDVLLEVAARLEGFELPEGYALELGGEGEKREASFAALRKALVLAVFLIYGILSLQFNSFVQPFLILFTVPFGIIGAVAGLYVTGKPFGFMAFIGIVSLTGIIINDSIVLTDFANYLQRVRGHGLYEALLEAGRTRFRPVILTSLTTIAGMTPLAIWGGSLWSPLAVAISFGLLGSTVLILVILPVLYSLLVSQGEAKRSYRLLPRAWRWLRG